MTCSLHSELNYIHSKENNTYIVCSSVCTYYRLPQIISCLKTLISLHISVNVLFYTLGFIMLNIFRRIFQESQENIQAQA